MKFAWLIGLCLLCFALPVFAQETIVTAVNTTPNILVRTISTRQDQSNSVVAAIQLASPTYSDIFGEISDFSIFVELVAGDRGAEAYATTRKETVDLPVTTDGTTAPAGLTGRKTVCHMTVYNSPEFNRERALFHNIAHELAHCFQSYGVYEAGLSSAETSPWWFEGTAEWMAGQVFPPTDSIIMGDMQRNFATSMENNLSLLDLDYTASYFWRYIGWQMAARDVGTMIRNMPADADQPAYIVREVPFFADTLHSYAVALAHNRLPAQPAVDRLFGTNKPTANAAAPTVVDLPITPLGTQFITLTVANLPAGQGVELLYQPNGTNSQLSLPEGVMIGAGSPFFVCPATTTIRLVQSRSDTTASGTTPQLFINPKPCELTEPPAPAEVDSCLVGAWVVDTRDGFGPEGGHKQPVNWGGYWVTISGDGFVTANMRISSKVGSMEVKMMWSAVVRATRVVSGSPIVGTTLSTTNMIIDAGGSITTVPTQLNGAGAMRLTCEEDGTLLMTEPTSNTSFRFLRR